MQHVDRMLEPNRVDVSVSVPVMVLYDLDNASSAEAPQDLCARRPFGTPHIIPHTVSGSRASPTHGIHFMGVACGSDSARRAERLIFCSSKSASAFFANCPPGCATRPRVRR